MACVVSVLLPAVVGIRIVGMPGSLQQIAAKEGPHFPLVNGHHRRPLGHIQG